MLTQVIREQMGKSIRYINPVSYEQATGLTGSLYAQMQADFLPVPPFTLHSPLPSVMAGVWSILRETTQAGSVERGLKEAVAATVSKMNECPYCVDVHTSMLHATSEHDAAQAILHGHFDQIQDARIRGVVEWLQVHRTANPSHPLPPPFTESEAPEIIGTVVAFHYINRMVNIFLGETFLPLPSALKGFAGRVFGVTAGKRLIQRSVEPGLSLKFIPQAQLPDDLSWAASNPSVASAFAGFAQVVEEAGESVLPLAVRTLVRERVQTWNGEPMGLSRRWVDEAVSELNQEYRATARLTLLTALASYQVDSKTVENFQAQDADDAHLLAATAWASLTAARRVGMWLMASAYRPV
jgi:AhpD family alkylhydroperoxidase